MSEYSVRRSKLSLGIGYFFAESVLMAFLIGMLVIWQEEPGYLNWTLAIGSWIAVALFFHFLLFIGTFYKIKVNGEMIECHAFLRRKRIFSFSDISGVTSSAGLDVKITGHSNQCLFYVKLTDRNADRFLDDVAAHLAGKAVHNMH